MSKKILLVGGGGHCMSVLDSLLSKGEYFEIGIIDRMENVGKNILGIPIVGTDDDLPRLFQEDFRCAFVSIGSIGNTKLRVKLFNTLENVGFEIPNIIDKSAVISNHVTLEKGIFVGKNAVINAGSTLHRGSIVNTSTVIEHESTVGEFTHISPGTVICGEVSVGNHTHIGANSVVKQQVNIGSNTIIGMGSVVLKDIGNNFIAFGNPCREVNSI